MTNENNKYAGACQLSRQDLPQVVQGVLSPSVLNFIQKYGLLQIRRYPAVCDGDLDDQVPQTHWTYADPLMEVLLLEMAPIVQQTTGLDVLPTYSYYRIYKPGDVLAHHIDRPACEVSGTLHLGHDYSGMPDDYRWTINAEDKNGNDIRIAQDPGDIVIYSGLEIDHWRDKFDVPEHCWHMQVFLHYVHANGPYAHLSMDRRENIGFPGSSQDDVKMLIETVPTHFKYLNPGDYGHPYSAKEMEEYANLQTN
tara:strand:+ start:1027 stop:1782 length:756 start_codon:yes stop_codon:yes gene_type:complete